MFHEDFVKIIPKILNKKGILNAGGKIQTIYDFAKKSNPMVKKKSGRKVFPPNPSMNISKMKKFIQFYIYFFYKDLILPKHKKKFLRNSTISI